MIDKPPEKMDVRKWRVPNLIERSGVLVRIGILLCGIWLVCMFVFRPWEPVESASPAARNRTPRTPGTVEQLTRFVWKIGAQAEESVTNLLWRPPELPILSVNDPHHALALWIDGEYWQRDSPGQILDYLADKSWLVAGEPFTPVIRKDEISAARRDGYQDWEILEVVRYGRHLGA